MEVKSYINADEKLLWKGQPTATETLNKTYRKKLISTGIIVACVLAAFLALFLFLANRQGVPMSWGFYALVVVIACIPIMNIFSEAAKVSKAEYLATDKRLIVVFADGAKDLDYERITEAAFRTDDDRLTTLLCGTKAVRSKPASWRDCTVRGDQASRADKDAKLPCESFAFYAVNDPDGLRTVLRDKLSCPIK